MPSTRHPLQLLALLPLFLMLTACPHPLTPSSTARTERPRLPTRSPELTKTEHLAPISGRRSGESVLVDKGWLTELLERLAEYAAAVTRGNERAGGNKLHDRCVAAILATGKMSPDCPKD